MLETLLELQSQKATMTLIVTPRFISTCSVSGTAVTVVADVPHHLNPVKEYLSKM